MHGMYEKGKRKLMVVLAAVLLSFLIYAMQNTYSAYTHMVVQQQQQHLLIISRAVAQNLQLYISEQLRTVSTLTQTPGFIDGFEEYYTTGETAKIKEYALSYTMSHQQGLARIYLLDRQGEQIFHYNQYPFFEDFDEDALDMTAYSDTGMSGIGSVFRISDNHYGLALANSVYGGNGHLGTMVSVIDMDVLYKEFVAPLNIEKLGYITVKNRRKTVIMHPDPKMITFNYQTDIPDIGTLPQYKSLNQMLQKQYSNEEGTAIYEAFSNGILPPEKEICAFSRMNLGGTSWYVSAAMPYSVAIGIENENLQRFGLLASAILLLVIVGGMVIYTLQKNRQKLQIETRYLRDINYTLEELHQSREQVRHYQKLMTIGTLAGGIAHEFNNLLTPIMGYSEFLMEQMGKNSKYYEDIEEIFTAGTKAKEIVEQILPFSRKETDSAAFSTISIDVIVHDALKMIRLLIPANIMLSEQLHAGGINVYGNATQLHQILLNLYSNAYQSMDENGGKLTVKTEKITSQKLPGSYKGVAETDFVKIMVEDSGCGMSEEVLHQIFNPFFTTKDSGEGTGLGLSVVKNILMNHGGFITTESQPGKGSKFFVYLPVTDIPIVTELHQKTEEDKVKDISLLLVDDDSHVLGYLKKRLTHKGYRVDAYTDPQKAMDAMKQQPNRWDAAVLDYMMPLYKGTTLAQHMKKLHPTVGIIMITGMVERDALQLKLDGIIDHIIIKPVKFEELLTSIDWLVKKKGDEE
ncbi:MAG: ATP-binding protein [Clostridium sp.]